MKTAFQFITTHAVLILLCGCWAVVAIVAGCVLAMSRESDPEMTSERDSKE